MAPGLVITFLTFILVPSTITEFLFGQLLRYREKEHKIKIQKFIQL
jgi:hypothetical protein